MPAPVAVVAPPAPAAAATVVAKPVVPTPNGAQKGGQPAAPPVAAPEPKVKLKVDGEMVEMTQAELERWASKGKFSDKVTQEGREAIKRAKAIAEKLEAEAASGKERAKTDTDAWLKEHGIDPDEFAKSRLEKKVEEGKMTAEQREHAAAKAENARLKAEQEKLSKEREAERTQQLTNQLQKNIQGELVNAAKRANMSLGDESFYAIYESFREAFELGLLPTDGNGLLPHHADRIIEEAQGRLDGAQKSIRDNALKLNGQALADFIGQDVVDKCATLKLEQIRARRGVAQADAPKPKPQQTNRPKTYMTPAELDAEVKKMAAKL